MTCKAMTSIHLECMDIVISLFSCYDLEEQRFALLVFFCCCFFGILRNDFWVLVCFLLLSRSCKQSE